MRWSEPTEKVIFVAAIVSLVAACTGGPYVPPLAETTRENPILHGTQGAYLDPDNPAAVWVRTHRDDARSKTLAGVFDNESVGIHLSEQPKTAQIEARTVSRAASRANRVPVFVTPALTGMPCGVTPLGDASGDRSPTPWIAAVREGIGNRPAVIVLEPDALVDWTCLTAKQQDKRVSQLASSIRNLQMVSNVSILLGAGSGDTASAETMAGRLKKVGLGDVDGIVTNFRGYVPTARASKFAREVRDLLGSKHSRLNLLVDTGRSGAAVTGSCNPPQGRSGQRAYLTGDSTRVKKFWLTIPGTSDGPCGAAPHTQRGKFNADLAMQQLGSTKETNAMKAPNDVRMELENHLAGESSVRSVAISAPTESDPATWTLIVIVARMPSVQNRIRSFEGVDVRYIIGSGFRG